MIARVSPASKLSGRPSIPGDKSISHRGLIFGALAEGVTEIEHLLQSEDVQSTARCLREMGVEITSRDGKTIVKGRGAQGLKTPSGVLDCGNSGTTMRLLMGVIAGQPGLHVEMTGDSSLVRRPMKRVAEPLEKMGGQFELTNGNFAPLSVIGTSLSGMDYELKVASAQIKSAILLAALGAEGDTRLHTPLLSRDHTERLLPHFGVELTVDGTNIHLKGGQALKANTLRVPGDPSTAAFWLAGACLVPGARIEMDNISLNPTRTGFIRALERMGAKVEVEVTSERPEPVGRVSVGHCELRGIVITEEDVPSLIDELPMLAVLASQAQGRTEVRGAEELRVKETDRIEAVAKNLRAMGIEVEVRPDGFVIEGPQRLRGADLESFHDHRIAMAFSIGALVAEGETRIHGAECVSISYPEFYSTLEELIS